MYNNKEFNSNKGATIIRKVNSILRKNRRILEEMLPPGEEKLKTMRDVLAGKGFNFNYHTSAFAHKRGAVYYFCYEYGVLKLGNDQFIIVKRNEIVR